MNKLREIVHVIFVVGVAFTSVLAVSGVTRNKTSALGADARTIYNRRCVSCHGRDGRGRTRKGRQTHARDMTSREWQDDVSDERLFNSINNGRGKMPAFHKKISENDIDALVAYVRRMRR
jgi:mono/diheme cytochrome c family protein